jgi:hypothetical protein
MSAIERALRCLASPGAVLAHGPSSGNFGVYAGGDRRRRPVAKLRVEDVRELVSSGALEASPRRDGFILTPAGRSRSARHTASPSERFFVQHGTIVARETLDERGETRLVRGVAQSSVLQRLAALRDGNGAPWLTGGELAAAARLRAHWEAGQAGLVRGSDLTAPPNASGARGASSAQEAALAARCDARRAVSNALDALAPPLRRVVERICLHEDGLEALERSEGWPARSGKLALKLGLAQLAAAF